MRTYLFYLAIISLSAPLSAFAQSEREVRYEVEGGVLGTRSMEIHGYEQGNATADWGSTDPTARLEYWSVKRNHWNYGVVAQPLYAHYSDTVASDLNYNGEVYHKGDHGTLDYQFHSVRGTANYTLLGRDEEHRYLRGGGSLIARYAEVNFKTDSGSFHDTNFIAFPLLNIESEFALYDGYTFFTRGDVFLDGLFDVLFALRRYVDKDSSVDVGVRLFFGGYNPNKADDYANRIFFNGAVVRYSW
jgi:hypothetical protein